MDTARRDAFLEMADTHKGILYKIARLYEKDEDDRKDLLQEMLLQLWLSFDKYDGSTRLSTWIYRIALNVAISAYRKQARRREVREPVPETTIGADPETDELLDRLKAYIQELRELDRALLILSLDGNSHIEIADILGITPTNVSTRLSRVRQQLRQKFNP